jgi:hypothetical protein
MTARISLIPKKRALVERPYSSVSANFAKVSFHGGELLAVFAKVTGPLIEGDGREAAGGRSHTLWKSTFSAFCG